MWHTSAASIGTCRRFEMRLDDGTVQTLRFRFGAQPRSGGQGRRRCGLRHRARTPPCHRDVLANDTEADGDTLSVASVSRTHLRGSLSWRPGGTFRYVPGTAFDSLRSGATATDVFDYRLSDGRGGTDTARARFRVTGVNDAPGVPDVARSVSEGASNGTAIGAPIGVTDPDTGDPTPLPSPPAMRAARSRSVPRRAS